MAGRMKTGNGYQPLVMVDTSDLPREEWLQYRKRGIGGSDVGAIFGVSPFRTCRDIYYDKLGIAVVLDDDSNWVQLEVGHLLEDLVAQIFHKKTGYPVYQIKKMFYHPKYPFMLADVDYFINLPSGKTAILECKTTNYNAKDNWFLDGEEIVPIYYELQGRHYMTVMDVDEVYFCCLYGNTEDEVIIRHITRDRDCEEELIFMEADFWQNHVQKKCPPPFTESGDMIIATTKRFSGLADLEAPEITLNMTMTAALMRYLELKEQKAKSEKFTIQMDAEMERIKGLLIAEMGQSCKASCVQDGNRYTVTYNPVRKAVIDKNNLMRLKLLYPDIYEEFVTISESRRFNVKTVWGNAA